MTIFRVSSPDFQNNVLTLEMSSVFKGPILLLNGEVVSFSKRKAVIKDDSYKDREIYLISNFVNLPSVKIDSEVFYPLGRLNFFEKILVVLPLGLLVIGGAIGGGLGVGSAYVNIFLMIKYKESNLKYLLAASTTGIAFLIWLLFFALIQMMRAT